MNRKSGFTTQHQDIKEFSFKPIGAVHSPIKEPEKRDWDEVIAFEKIKDML